jgi:hypothetical protein
MPIAHPYGSFYIFHVAFSALSVVIVPTCSVNGFNANDVSDYILFSQNLLRTGL